MRKIVLALALLFSTNSFATKEVIIEQEAEYNQFASIVVTNQKCSFPELVKEGFLTSARMERYDGSKLQGCYKPQRGTPNATVTNQKTPWICQFPQKDAIVIKWDPEFIAVVTKATGKSEPYSCFDADRFLDNAKTHITPKKDSI